MGEMRGEELQVLLGRRALWSAECQAPAVPEESSWKQNLSFQFSLLVNGQTRTAHPTAPGAVPKAQMQDRGRHSSLPLLNARLPRPDQPVLTVHTCWGGHPRSVLGVSLFVAPARTQVLKIQALRSREKAYDKLRVTMRCWLKLIYNLLSKAPYSLPMGTSLPH